MIRVLVADGEDTVRAAFRRTLSVEPGVEVVGEASTGVEAVVLAERLRPHVVLMDVALPELDGLAATRAVAARPGCPRVVVVTALDRDEYVYGAVRAGACGFLLKDAGPGLLVEAVRAAVHGAAVVSPSVTVRLLRDLAPGAERPAAPSRRLTARERDVARAVARGRTNAEIAGELSVSLSTVKTHLASVQIKLTARNRVAVAAWAWQNGLAGCVDGLSRRATASAQGSSRGRPG